MKGIEMLIKSFGIDPEEIKRTVTGVVKTIEDLNATLVRIENKVDVLYDAQAARDKLAIAAE